MINMTTKTGLPNKEKGLSLIHIFVGMKGRGLPVCTIIRGNVVAEDGKITAEKGVGTLVRRLS